MVREPLMPLSSPLPSSGAGGGGTHLSSGQGDANADEMLEGDDASPGSSSTWVGQISLMAFLLCRYRTAITQQV